MEEVTQQSSQHIGCPRCGYDLSGEVQRWCDQCPLEGVCSECGLKIRWGGLLGVDVRRPESFFETSRAKPRRAFLGTLSRAKNPFRFWNWVKMEYEFNWKRMVLLSLVGMLAIHTLFTVAVVVLCVAIHSAAVSGPNPYGYPFPTSTQIVIYSSKIVGVPFLGDFTYSRYSRYSPPLVGLPAWILMGGLSIATMSLAFMLLPRTLSNAKVRTVHLVRVMCYSFIWLPMSWCILTGALVLKSMFDYYKAYGPGTTQRAFWSEWIDYLGHKADSLAKTLHPYEYVITLAVVFGWSVFWWWGAGKYYLKIPRPFMISITLTILSTLAVLAVTLPVFGV